MLHSSSSGFHDVLKSPCRVSVFQVNEQFWQKFCIYFITVLNGVVMLIIDSINNFSRIFQQSQKPQSWQYYGILYQRLSFASRKYCATQNNLSLQKTAIVNLYHYHKTMNNVSRIHHLQFCCIQMYLISNRFKGKITTILQQFRKLIRAFQTKIVITYHIFFMIC